LAGYDPKTRQLMDDHPLYGKLEEPIVDANMIDYIEQIAKSQSSLHGQIKDIRNHRAFFTSPYGPHPDEEKPEYWQEHEDGFTYGPGHFWSSPFQSTGGAGTNLATYHEILNAIHADEDGVSPFGEITENRDNYIQPSELNNSLANHFMPLRTQGIGEVQKDGKYYNFKYNNDAEHLQNLLSPFGTSRKRPNREGATNKNNYTEHKSSLNPQYEYAIRHLSENEMKNKFVGPYLRAMAFPHTIVPTLHVGGYTAYGASPSDSRSHANALLAHNMETLGGRMFHPHTPAKKSFSTAKDWKRGDESASGGMSRDEFTDFMRWGGQSGFSFDSMKNRVLDNPSMNHALAAITHASKILDTQNPKEILAYLNGEENHDELNSVMLNRNLGEFDKNKLNEALGRLIGEMNQEIQSAKANQKSKTTMAAGEADAVARFLQFGGMLPASQKEEDMADYVDSLNQRLMTMQQTGASLEEILPVRDELQQMSAQLEQLQARAAVRKPTTHWEKDQGRFEQLVKGHRQTIAQVARDIILPKYLEHDPNAFDPNDPATFIANHHQLMRDAQRYIASVPHSMHGITTTNYGSDLTVKPTSQGVKNPFHKTMAEHLSTDGKMIDGTMSVDEVLSILGVEKTNVAKEKARELINLSSEKNTPLFASTVKDVLLSGKIPNIDGINLNQFSDEELMNKPEEELSDEERFVRHARENG